MNIGILAAMPQELELLNTELVCSSIKNIGNRAYYHGHLFDTPQQQLILTILLRI